MRRGTHSASTGSKARYTLAPMRRHTLLPSLALVAAWSIGGQVFAAQAAEPDTDVASNGEPSPGRSGEAEAGGSASVSSSGTNASFEGRSTGRTGWIRLHGPRPGQVDLGLYGGLYFPSKVHSYLGSGATFKELQTVMGSLGARIGYYPLSWVGAEAEGGGFPGRIAGGSYVHLYHVRAHLVFQVPFRLSPFLLFGPSALVVNSVPAQLGRDIDPAAHAGAGVKFFLNRLVSLRLEWRSTLAPHRDTRRRPSHHGELLLGVTFSFGPKLAEKAPMPPPPSDRDGDGFLDPYDKCPDEPGVMPDGCPSPDRDGDGFPNEEDACPDEPGVAPDGCPIRDRDRDGFPDDVDACPDEPGVDPDGCPLGDRDGDGILDRDDQCPDDPETFNGFEDTDGCPDEVPEEVQRFTGVIQGINFDTNRATIRPDSHRVLDEAVEVLKRHPTIRLEIVGHTDSTGRVDRNMELSRERATAVRQYLVDRGIEGDRLVARGAGPHEPLTTNATKEGRAENRRTEFKIRP
jgi:outer membrane protein OmpA-like peptidoglycan-associated protein